VTVSVRRLRLAGTVARHLAVELAREVRDPRLAALGIEKVDVSGDLSVVKVSVRLFQGETDAAARGAVMAALVRMTPGLRASLGPLLRLRRVPELRFVYDEGADQRARIESLLGEIEVEDAARRAALEQAQGDPRAPGEDAPEAGEPAAEKP
jgi:ribosome-binding factor A